MIVSANRSGNWNLFIESAHTMINSHAFPIGKAWLFNRILVVKDRHQQAVSSQISV
ncbi:hypothetical protein BN8_00016 [Fibrisoma limi BUZ 3]|uniref:Uncharacterized protein n=1 Tax=Fibrisoma limi BUZ 3 TaxID=1185876 RepID=I2GB37_9BACT|nr:hypothetical protein BN8_00016 [Fibrisoma limi BUZ 3]